MLLFFAPVDAIVAQVSLQLEGFILIQSFDFRYHVNDSSDYNNYPFSAMCPNRFFVQWHTNFSCFCFWNYQKESSQ